MGFSTTVSDHIRSNVVGYVALFFALSGGAAWATHPGGENTISTIDIQNGEVKKDDLGADSVRTGKIQDGQVTSDDVATDTLTKADLGSNSVGPFELDGGAFRPEDIKAQFGPNFSKGYAIPPNAIQSDEVSDQSLASPDLGPGSVGSSEAANDSLGGGDINESTLSALDGHDTFDDFCNPATTTFITCEELTFTIGRRMQVLTIFNYGFGSGTSDYPSGACRTTLDGADSSPAIELRAPDQPFSSLGGIPVVDVVTLNAGTHTIGLRCQEQVPDDRDIQIKDIRLAAVELGMD
jgi:hypothetical protein